MSFKSVVRQIPLVVPAWRALNRIPLVTRAREAWQLKRMYGQFAPDSLVLANSGSTMFVDPNERRGRAVLRCRAGGQPILKAIWGRMNKLLQPTLVLDVGLNYGEFVLNEHYPADAAILGIEANPALIPWLERSRAAHPNAAQMRFLHALADAKSGATSKFFINPTWSGSSSALEDKSRSDFMPCEVPVIAIDDLVAERDLEQDRLIFKIDVEGYEPVVMRGMKSLLKRCPRWLGLVEFNATYLDRLGVTAGSILGELLEHARVFGIDHHGRSKEILTPDLQQHFPNEQPSEISLDLLLISKAANVPPEQLLSSS